MLEDDCDPDAVRVAVAVSEVVKAAEDEEEVEDVIVKVCVAELEPELVQVPEKELV